MNLLSLKTGMLIRDTDKLLEVVRVREDSATAIVILDNLKAPKTAAQQITYSSDGVWQFVARPTEKQLAALEALRNGQLGFAAISAALEGGYIPVEGDRELMAGDRVSWLQGSYRVHGLFYRHLLDFVVCVSLGTGKRVALKSGMITKECG